MATRSGILAGRSRASASATASWRIPPIDIQKDSPGRARESNWLPAPDGPIHLVMRLYWPKETPPSVLPPGEGTWKPPGVKRVS